MILMILIIIFVNNSSYIIIKEIKMSAIKKSEYSPIIFLYNKKIVSKDFLINNLKHSFCFEGKVLKYLKQLENLGIELEKNAVYFYADFDKFISKIKSKSINF